MTVFARYTETTATGTAAASATDTERQPCPASSGDSRILSSTKILVSQASSTETITMARQAGQSGACPRQSAYRLMIGQCHR
jgi:hypothetical protein